MTGSPSPRPRLVCITTHAMSANLLMRGQLRFMREQGFDVTVIASPGPHLETVREREGVEVVPIPIEREINPVKDVVSLWRLAVQLARIRPVIVNAGTPKAGLLGMIAAALLRVPVRVYVVRGLRAEGAQGLRLRVLEFTERLASAAAQIVLPVSHSLKREYVRRRLVAERKTLVIGSGSSNGIDPARFDRGRRSDEQIAAKRAELGIERDAPVLGFVGRFTRDKGIGELLDAYDIVRREFPRLHLLLLGDLEAGDPVTAHDRERMTSDPRIVHPGFVSDPSEYYPLMDVFAFPSYREGFPNAPLEAAASGVPTVGFSATGTVDAVASGVTGFLVPVGDAKALAARILDYLRDPALRRQHGRAARERVVREFEHRVIWRGLFELYASMLEKRSLPPPVPDQPSSVMTT